MKKESLSGFLEEVESKVSLIQIDPHFTLFIQVHGWWWSPNVFCRWMNTTARCSRHTKNQSPAIADEPRHSAILKHAPHEWKWPINFLNQSYDRAQNFFQEKKNWSVGQKLAPKKKKSPPATRKVQLFIFPRVNI